MLGEKSLSKEKKGDEASVITVEHLTKRYGEKIVLDGFSMTIQDVKNLLLWEKAVKERLHCFA